MPKSIGATVPKRDPRIPLPPPQDDPLKAARAFVIFLMRIGERMKPCEGGWLTQDHTGKREVVTDVWMRALIWNFLAEHCEYDARWVEYAGRPLTPNAADVVEVFAALPAAIASLVNGVR